MATTWDAAHKDTSIVLGRGDIVAAKNASAGTYLSVRGTTSKSSGKLYLEFICNCAISTVNGEGWSVGFADATFSVSSRVGSDAHSFGLAFRNNNTTLWYVNFPVNGTHSLWGQTTYHGMIVGVAIDFSAGRLWVQTDKTTNWNNDASADPATGTNGLDISAITGSPLYPVFSPYDATKTLQCTLNTGGMRFRFPIPSGFSAWDSGTPTLDGQSASPPTTWNPSDKDTHVALSSGNLVATQSTDSGIFDGVRSSTSYGSGLIYFEQTATTIGTGDTSPHHGWIGGIGTSNASLSNASGVPGADVESVGFQPTDGNIRFNGTNIFPANGPSVSQGDVIGFAVDAWRGLFWVKNVTTGSNWNNDVSADPVTGVKGFPIPGLGDFFIMWGGGDLAGTSDVSTLNTGATAFIGTKPTGFNAWDTPASSDAKQTAVSIIT